MPINEPKPRFRLVFDDWIDQPQKGMFNFLFGGTGPQKTPVPMVTVCPDCQVKNGQLHELFCLKESCPFCKGQLASCGCIDTVLELSEEEKQAVDEYVDDSVPPLLDIMDSWELALSKKGRIPFRVYPDDPFRAAYRNDTKVVKQFLAQGLEPNHENKVRNTLLMSACRGEAVEVLQLLL